MSKRIIGVALAATAAGAILGFVYGWFRDVRSDYWHADVSRFPAPDLCDDCGPGCSGGLISD